MSEKAPYKLWSLKALLTRCKEKGLKGYEEETDKAKLAALLEADDAVEESETVEEEPEVVEDETEELVDDEVEDEVAKVESEEEMLVVVEEEVLGEELEDEFVEDEVDKKLEEEILAEEPEEAIEEEGIIENEDIIEDEEELEEEEVETEAGAGIWGKKDETFAIKTLQLVAEDMGFEIVTLELKQLGLSDYEKELESDAEESELEKVAEPKPKTGKAQTTVSSKDLMQKIRNKKLWRKGAQFLSNDEKLQLLQAKNDEEREVVYAIMKKKSNKARAKQSAAMKKRHENGE